MNDPNVNVHDVQNAFNQWNEQQKTQNNNTSAYKVGETEAEEQGSELFKRWEYFMVPRTYPSGERPNQVANTQAYKAYLSSIQANSSSERITGASNWTYVGNTVVPGGGGGGDGRVNRVRFYPGNNNIIYACSPSGGLWKTTDGGNTWATNTDQLQEIGTSDIAINPLKPSIMYLATGDNDGAGSGSTPTTTGVLRSNDGGNTWNTTGLSYTIQSTGPNQSTTNQVVFSPIYTGRIFAANSIGLFYSKNNGISWTQSINSDNIKDVEFEPFHGYTVYAGSFAGNFYRSVDSGKTFVHVTTGLPSGVGRLAIGVTAADSNIVYVLAVNSSTNAFYGIYRSTDRGQTFSPMAELSTGAPNLLGWSPTGSDNSGQAWYNLAILVSPTYADSIFVAGSYLWQSSDGGTNWTYDANFANSIHVDIHSLVFYPGSSSSFLLSSDGGVAITPDAGNSWSDISNNLAIAEQYSLGMSADNAGLWLSGWQDNGTNISSPFWQWLYTGDGMTCFIDNTNDNNLYASYEYGAFAASSDGGNNWRNATGGITEAGGWNTPWLQDPQNPGTLFSGFKNVWKSINRGSSWSKISTWGSSTINAMAIAPSNDNCIYASEANGLYTTINGGSSWTNISSGLPVASEYLSNIAIDNFDQSHLWVTFSGWSGSFKVYTSTNGGANWTNISSGLPNLPVNCIVYQPGPAGGIYVGTDIGVYYMDNTTGGWIPYNIGLPNVEVFDLKLYKGNTLMAATFGRGTWQTSTYTNINLSTNNLAFTSSIKVYPNPTNGNVQVAFDGMAGEYEIKVVNVLGQTLVSNSIQTSGHYNDYINLSGFGKGVYIVSINGMNTKVEKKVVVY